MNDLLTRAVANVIPKKLAEEKLQSGKKLHIYWGIDPTGSKLHLGHAVSLRKLQQFVDAGHEIILVIGSFTAMIGDPSGRDELRQPLTRKQIEENFHTYKEQAAKVLDFSKITVRYNHEWLEKLTPELMVKLASHFTKQQMEQREMFARREKEGKPIHLSEFIYPLLVGYDSVVLNVDCELGGSDQEFNMLCGRHLQQVFGKREKFVLTLKLLEGTDGRKMSKTYENCIYLEDSPNEMFGKLMSIKDSLMETYFECCTDVPMDEVRVILSSSKDGMGPRDAKARLARAIVTLYHGAKEADAAEKEFTNVFSKGKLPKEIPEIISTGDDPLGELVKSGLVSSKSDARRLLKEKGIKLLDEQGNTILVTELESELGEAMAKTFNQKHSAIVKIGKKKFLRFIVSKSFTDIFPDSVPNYPPKV
ncbi:tyrosine--tRNA ligase [Candidatus Peribacteria bacterium RIFCSPLOWO2_02_FULL_55_36]|nr:MAG: tyrosine--tRNA ligase [Candidatus Peribacteria bacterium RIFCSPLOWO2_01_FULL_54_110]OGJ69700.1 MAG: tyrosine--tRNA ligase [Candidatus Peribacteria bacterium RIFCSPLOWO2_02_FULL_55_36]